MYISTSCILNVSEITSKYFVPRIINNGNKSLRNYETGFKLLTISEKNNENQELVTI